MKFQGQDGFTPEQVEALLNQDFGGNGATSERLKLFGIDQQAENIEEEVSGDISTGITEEEPKKTKPKRGRKKK